jgi:2-haloacid dehalogenase
MSCHLRVRRRDVLRGLTAALLVRGMKATDTRLDPASIRALTFDVFGTVVDWRSSIARELRRFFGPRGIERKWEAVADRWRGLYQPAMEEVRRGRRPWVRLDDLHRENLTVVLDEFGLAGLQTTRSGI